MNSNWLATFHPACHPYKYHHFQRRIYAMRQQMRSFEMVNRSRKWFNQWAHFWLLYRWLHCWRTYRFARRLVGSNAAHIHILVISNWKCIDFSSANGKSVDATQELLAIGTSNVLNSFVSGFPGTGSLSRGAVNNASGVRTPLGNLYTGGLVLLSLLFLTPLFYYIPKAALAAIIISAVVFMVEVKVIKPMWRSKSETIWNKFNIINIIGLTHWYFNEHFQNPICCRDWPHSSPVSYFQWNTAFWLASV